MTPETTPHFLIKKIDKLTLATDGKYYHSLRIVEDNDDGIVATKYAYAYSPGNQAQYKNALNTARKKADELERKWAKKMKLSPPPKRRQYNVKEVDAYKARKSEHGKIRNEGIYAA